MPQYARAKKEEWVGGVAGWRKGIGDFWDSIRNVNVINTQLKKKKKKSRNVIGV